MGSSGLLAVCQVRFPVLDKQPCSASKCAGLSNKLQLPSPDLATVIDQKETLHCLHGLWMVVGDCHCNKGSTSWNMPSPSFAPSVLCQTMDMKVDQIVALRWEPSAWWDVLPTSLPSLHTLACCSQPSLHHNQQHGTVTLLHVLPFSQVAESPWEALPIGHQFLWYGHCKEAYQERDQPGHFAWYAHFLQPHPWKWFAQA